MSASRRGVTTVLDQGVSSVTNVALTILVARSVAPAEFGAFALLYATYVFLTGAVRAATSEPLAVRHSLASGDEFRAAASRAMGTALAVSLVCGALLAAASPLLGEYVLAPGLAMAVCLPGLLAQDCLRWVYFTWGRPAGALANDSLWALTQLGGVAALMAVGSATTTTMVAAWGASATLCAAVGVVHVGLRPRPGQVGGWLREQRDLWPRFVAEYALGGGARQGVVFAVTGIAGLVATAALRLADTLLGPIRIVLQAASGIGIPEAVKYADGDAGRLRRFVAGGALLLATVALAWTLVLLLAPGSWWVAVVGEIWSDAEPAVLPLGLAWIATGIGTAHLIGLRALGAASASLKARLVDAPLYFGGGCVGAALDGAVGAAWGMAAGSALAAVVWRLQFVRTCQREEG